MSNATRKPNLPRAEDCVPQTRTEARLLRASLRAYCERNGYEVVVQPYVRLIASYYARARVRCTETGREAQVWAPVGSEISGADSIGTWSRNGWSNASTK